MKKILLLLCACFFMLNINGQNIGGVINSYAAVTSIDPCVAFIVVDDGTLFQEGDRLILIQMQGADISTNDNSSYGYVQDLNSAGQWEIIHVNSIINDSLFLDFGIDNNYEIGGKVQVVSFPSYTNAQVISTLSCSPWNGITGGVIAFTAQTLNMNADISVDGMGFRGGANIEQDNNNCNGILPENNYTYDGNDWRGSRKGESVWINDTNQPAGRGAPANGGGGGNDHNSGGGGGANVTSAGQGGQNLEPSFFGCHGYFPGLGGKALDYNLNRLFLGGGGGAGHGNNENSTAGGQGGGIIILQTEQLETNGFALSANGGNGLSTSGDGAGGGGAAGTIYLDIPSTESNVLISLKGGNGGSVDNNNADRCQGPGGGGSGGFLVSDIPLGQINYNGGERGLSMQSNVNNCTPENVGSEVGQNGLITALYPWIESTSHPQDLTAFIDLFGINVCPSQADTITIVNSLFVDYYQWQYFDGNDWIDIIENAFFEGTQTASLIVHDLPTDFTIDFIRCQISNVCGYLDFTNMITVQVAEPFVIDFDFTINNQMVTFNNLSGLGLTYHWDFGDDMMSNDFQPIHFYDEIGSFEVVLTVSDGCFTLETSMTVTLEEILQISWSNEQACAPTTIVFTTPTTGSNYAWIFEGGDPATSTSPTPSIDYFTPGLFDVSLVVDGTSQTFLDTVRVFQTPFPGFDFNIDGGMVTFTNTTLNATNYLWNFGDGSDLSTEINPTHNYDSGSNYTVTLQAFDGPCSIIISQNIGAITGTTSTLNPTFYNIYPNPVSDHLIIYNTRTKGCAYILYDIEGKQITNGRIKSGQNILDLSSIIEGVYTLILKTDDGLWMVKKIVKM